MIADQKNCDVCQFDCEAHGYCKIDAINDVDMQDTYLYDVLRDKGYNGCNLKPQKIRGKYRLILYPFNYGYLLCEKMNLECGVSVAPLKTRYTHGLAGLDLSNCYGDFLSRIDQVSCSDQPVQMDHVIKPEDMFKYVQEHYGETVEHCKEININKPAEIINVVNATHNLNLYIVSDSEGITGYYSQEVIV